MSSQYQNGLQYYLTGSLVAEGKCYIDTLVPIACEAIPADDYIVNSLILHDLVIRFHRIDIPLSICQVILDQLHSNGYAEEIQSKASISFRILSREPAKGLADKRLAYRTRLTSLSDDICDYARKRDLPILSDDIEEDIILFLKSRIDMFLDDVHSDFHKGSNVCKDERLFEAFFMDHYYIGTDIKNITNILLCGIICTDFHFPSLNGTPETMLFNSLYVFIDTPLLLYQLGYVGELRQSITFDIFTQLANCGARIYCFEHTISESINILCAAKAIIQNLLQPERLSMRLTVAHFQSFPNPAYEVDMAILRIRENISARGVSICDEDMYKDENRNRVIDEVGLSRYIASKMKTRNYSEQSIENDVQSIARTHLFRSSVTPIDIRNAGAIFLTNNSALEECSRVLLVPCEKGRQPTRLPDRKVTDILAVF
jgi:hypothetical protein